MSNLSPEYVTVINSREHIVGLPTGERLMTGENKVLASSIEKCEGHPAYRNIKRLGWLSVVKREESNISQVKEIYKELSFQEAKRFLNNEDNSAILIEVYPLIKQKSLKKLVEKKLDEMGA